METIGKLMDWSTGWGPPPSAPKIKIRRLSDDAVLPAFGTIGSAAFDFHIIETATIEAGGLQLLSTGLVIATPANHMLMVTLRSSTPRKYGLTMPQGVGIVDEDYCGDEDEIKIQVRNFRFTPVVVKRGARLAQGTFVPVFRSFDWQPTDEMGASRGGFGSTDER